jgi:hypothetical protein
MTPSLLQSRKEALNIFKKAYKLPPSSFSCEGGIIPLAEQGKWELSKIIIETDRIEGKDEKKKIARDMYFGLKSGNTHIHTDGNFILEQKIGTKNVELLRAIKDDFEKCNVEHLFFKFKLLITYTSLMNKTLHMANLGLVQKMKSLIYFDKSKKPEEYLIEEVTIKGITEAVFTHSKTKDFIKEIEEYTINIIKKYDGNINKINTIKRDMARPQYSRMIDMFCGLKIAINDTWGHRVKIIDYKYDSNSKKFNVKLKIKIIDHFGLDYDDIKKFGTTELVLKMLPNFMQIILKVYSNDITKTINSMAREVAEGFRAWFILQHYHGYRPFVNFMEKEITIDGQL